MIENTLNLTFKWPRYVTHLKMKEFVSTLYSFEYDVKNGSNESESDVDEEINICIQEPDESSEESDSEVFTNPCAKILGLQFTERYLPKGVNFRPLEI